MTALIMFFMAFIIALWTAARLWQGQNLSPHYKALFYTFFVFIWLLPLIYRQLGFQVPIVYTFPYHLFGFLFFWAYLFFIFIFIQDVFWGIRYIIRFLKGSSKPFPWKREARIKKSNAVLLGCSFVLALFALYAGLKTPDVKEVKIYTSKLPSNITIVALSDLHLHHNLSLKKIQEIVDKVNAIQPDMIVFLGDFADERTNHLHQQLFELSQLKAPLGKYAVAGNHDFYLGHEEAKEAFKEAEFTYLFNEGVQVTPQLYLAGIPDYRTVRQISDSVDIIRALSSAQPSDYKILLSHRPKLIDTLVPKQIDLQLSGHTHGGQVFPHHFMVKLFNKYLSGLYQTRHGKLYVTSGAGQWGAQMRLFAPSEITVIRLIAEAHDVLPGNHQKRTETAMKENGLAVKAMSEKEAVVPNKKTNKKRSALMPIVGKVLKKNVSVEKKTDNEKTVTEEKGNSEEKTDVKTEEVKTPSENQAKALTKPVEASAITEQTFSEKTLSKEPVQTMKAEESENPFENISKDIDSLIASIQPRQTTDSEFDDITDSETNDDIDETTDENEPDETLTNEISPEDAGSEEIPFYKEELYIEVLKKGGQISSVRVYNANHDLIADTTLREGTSVLTHTLHNTDGSVETHETIMHVRAMPDRHVTKETTQVFEKKRPQIKHFIPIVEEPVKPAFSPTEDALPSSVNNK